MFCTFASIRNRNARACVCIYMYTAKCAACVHVSRIKSSERILEAQSHRSAQIVLIRVGPGGSFPSPHAHQELKLPCALCSYLTIANSLFNPVPFLGTATAPPIIIANSLCDERSLVSAFSPPLPPSPCATGHRKGHLQSVAAQPRYVIDDGPV